MASQLPNEDEEDCGSAAAAAAAAAFHSALAQQVRPLLGAGSGAWDPVAAMATMQRNLIQQQHQHQQQLSNLHHNQQHQTNGTSLGGGHQSAMAALAAAANLNPQTSIPSSVPSHLWSYNLQAATAAALQSVLAQQMGPLMGAGGGGTWDPVSAMAMMQRNLLQQQQQQDLHHNQHQQNGGSLADHQAAISAAQAALAAAAAAGLNPQTSLPSALPPHLWPYGLHAAAANGTQNPLSQAQMAPVPTATSPTSSSMAASLASSLAAVNSSLSSPPLTNQHQDSLVDQHFRRSLGEDYNQIMASKAADKINVGK